MPQDIDNGRQHIERAEAAEARCLALEAEYARLTALLNTPELHDFARGVVLEAQHQRERWGSDHDAGKGPLDWFWLIGYLAQKSAHAAIAGDREKALHHTISTAAALANWHAALSGADTTMRPGIAEPKVEAWMGRSRPAGYSAGQAMAIFAPDDREAMMRSAMAAMVYFRDQTQAGEVPS